MVHDLTKRVTSPAAKYGQRRTLPPPQSIRTPPCPHTASPNDSSIPPSCGYRSHLLMKNMPLKPTSFPHEFCMIQHPCLAGENLPLPLSSTFAGVKGHSRDRCQIVSAGHSMHLMDLAATVVLWEWGIHGIRLRTQLSRATNGLET